jgi:hypothetical protein
MADDFKAGEAVICIDAAPDAKDPRADLLTEGRAYRVNTVGRTKDGELRLAFLCFPSSGGRGWAFCTHRFRKLPKADDRFAEQMRALKPHREKVPA